MERRSETDGGTSIPLERGQAGRKRVLIVYPFEAPFIRRDIDILSAWFDVRELNCRSCWTNGRAAAGLLVRMLRGMTWADAVFCWFADISAFSAVLFSQLLGRRSVVVVAGWDVAREPAIGYGQLLKPGYARMAAYVLNHADRILALDEGLKRDAVQNARARGGNIEVVPSGFDADTFRPGHAKEDIVVTVATGSTWSRARLKGLDTYVLSARELPDLQFVVIGIRGEALERLRAMAPPNVRFVHHWIPDGELLRCFQRARVYCQLSMREGLPTALCEAMLCGCVPVGAAVQGVTTAIGDTGYYAPYGDPAATAQAIRQAVDSGRGDLARERIMTLFPAGGRADRLRAILGGETAAAARR